MATPEDKQAEMAARRRRRSIVFALLLGAFVIIVYALTISKMGADVLQRPL